jgi:hypothetical protein
VENVKRVRIDEECYGGIEGSESTTTEKKEVEYLVFEFQHQRYLYDSAEGNFFVQQ